MSLYQLLAAQHAKNTNLRLATLIQIRFELIYYQITV